MKWGASPFTIPKLCRLKSLEPSAARVQRPGMSYKPLEPRQREPSQPNKPQLGPKDPNSPDQAAFSPLPLAPMACRGLVLEDHGLKSPPGLGCGKRGWNMTIL